MSCLTLFTVCGIGRVLDQFAVWKQRLLELSSQLLVAVVDGDVWVSVCMQDKGGRRETEIAIWPDKCYTTLIVWSSSKLGHSLREPALGVCCWNSSQQERTAGMSTEWWEQEFGLNTSILAVGRPPTTACFWASLRLLLGPDFLIPKMIKLN